MITPQEYNDYLNLTLHKNLIEEIDLKIKLHCSNLWYPWVDVLIEKEYNVNIRDLISREYLKNGWFCVCHRTNSENNERSGFTHFIFCTEKTYVDWIKSHEQYLSYWHIIYK